MAAPYVFTIPGRPFLLQAEGLREEFRRILGTPGETLSVERIFQFIGLTDANLDLQRSLIKRGIFSRDAGDVFRNVGRVIDTIARDISSDIPSLGLYIPSKLIISASFAGGTFTATPTLDTRVIITFDKPPLPGVGQRFVLDQILGTNEHWVYSFHDDYTLDNKVEIVVDMRLSAETKVLRQRDMRSGRRLTLQRRTLLDLEFSRFAGCHCDCCKGFSAARPGHDCPPIDRVLSLNLRIIVLLDVGETYAGAIQAAVNRQLLAMQELYQAQRITISVAGTNIVTDPARVVIDPGPCFRGRPSTDVINLHAAYAAIVQPNEIVCFVVRQVVGLAGCASHPDGRPGFVMDRTIGDPRDSVMGHELGHVLSLLHVPDRRNLMWGDDGNPIVDPPPDLYPDQVEAIRCYPPPWLT